MAPVNAPTPQPFHNELYKPHTMAPWQMAEFLILLDRTLGRSTFTPAKVQAGIKSFKGWHGSKPYMRWKGLLFWHCQSCFRGQCDPGLRWTVNVERCGTLRVLMHMATQGIQPELWMQTVPKQSLGVNTPYTLSAEEAKQAADKHADFRLAGVLVDVPNKEWRKRRAGGEALASAFTIVQYKARRSPEAEAAREAWLQAAPGEVERFVAKDKTLVPPEAAYQAKWRVVYDLKAINTASFKLPMAYGRQEDALAKVRPGDMLAVLDVKDGFTAIPVSTTTTTPFVFVTEGQGVMEAARMPFGYKLAPFLFCLFSGAVAQAASVAIGTEAGQVHMYMDDMLLALRKEAGGLQRANARVRGITALMEQCGAAVSAAKIEGPATAVTYLGLRIEATLPIPQVWMPAEKWFTLRELLRMMRALVARGEQPVLAKGAFDSLVGKLGAVAAILPLSKTDLAVLYRTKRKAGKDWQHWRRMKPVPLTADALQALVRLQQQIEAAPRREVNQGPAQAAIPTLFGAVDASGEGGLGGHLRRVGSDQAQCWSIRVAGAETGDEWVGLSTLLEIRAVVEAAKKAAAMRRPDEGWVRLQVVVDSQAAAALVRKGYSTRCGASNELCGKLQEILQAEKLQLVVSWLPRERNWRADWLSHPQNPAQPWMQSLPQHTSELSRRQEGRQ